MYKFLILGGDLRQLYLSQLLEKDGYHVTHYYEDHPDLFSLQEAIEDSNIVLCPIPFTRDKKNIFSANSLDGLRIEDVVKQLKSDHILFGGNIPTWIKDYCKENKIYCFDFMSMEQVAIKNTIATAEGAIAEAITLSPINLHHSQCFVNGFGRCGQTLARKLKGMDAHVTVSDQNSKKLALAYSYGYQTLMPKELASFIGKYHFIFNTIPALTLDEPLISSMNSHVTIIDIASSPGGVNFDACKGAGLNAELCQGLPGKYSPLTSAEILYEAVLSAITEGDLHT